METNAIEIKGLTKHYKDFSLENLDLTLPAGCVLGLVGENGAGKSTTIRLIMDALERDGGTVSVLGVDNQSKAFQDLKEDIGVVLDETFVPEILSAKQLGKIMAGTFRNWDQAAYDGWLNRLGLPQAGWTPWSGRSCWRCSRISPPRMATQCCSPATLSATWSAFATTSPSCTRGS